MSIAPSRLALVVVAALGLPFSCNNDPLCSPEGKAPQIDWQDINDRIKQVIDVGDLESLTDDQLSAKYTTNKIEAVVRRPTATGNRYLLLVQRAGQQQAIVIPGTNINNIENVLSDLDSTPVFDPELGVEFHRGFHELADDIRADVEPLLNPHYATHLTGYSLGGAMAAILSLQLNLHGFDVASVVTFGQPKVAFAESAQAFADRPLLRFIAAHDGIPVLFTDYPYVHFGEEVILLDGPNLVYLTPRDLNYVISTSNPPEASGALNINDHGTYLARIASKMDGRIDQVSFCSREQFIALE
jgi:triacylglycerol lipase